MQRRARRAGARAGLLLWSDRCSELQSAEQGSPSASQECEVAVQRAMALEEFALALDMLLQYYQDAMVSYCYSHFLDRHLAQEVAQEIFLAVFEGMPRFRGESSVKTWLYGIASKKCLEVSRTKTRREALARHNEQRIGAQAHCAPPPQPEELFRQEWQRQRVWKALRRLRVYDRELLILRHLEELSCDEIASIFKVSKRTVERHLPRAEAKFYKTFQKV